MTDEVESLTAARAGAMSGTEPTDALRVGNFDFNSSFREAQAFSFERWSTHFSRNSIS